MEENNPFNLKRHFIPTPNSGFIDTPAPTTYWFIFYKDKLLLEVRKDLALHIITKSPQQLGLEPSYQRFFGFYDQVPCHVAELSSIDTVGTSLQPFGLRKLANKVDRELFNLAGRAIQVLYHHREHQFCSRCGARMEERESELAKGCPECDFTSFPRVSPAVIMAVTRGDEILLGRAPHFPKGVYSTLAGFVEPGETLEEAVRREVYEETGITVDNIEYFSNQAWPFPHSIMIGFKAQYRSGTISVDTSELTDARWFSLDNMPKIPTSVTIARMLIDDFLSSFS